MKHKTLLGLILAAAALLRAPALAHGCSVCLTGDTGPMGDAYNWSVLFLMATPYTVMASVGAWLVYKYRRASTKERRAAGDQPLTQLTLNYKENGND
jgi:hypothetical protein